MRAKPSVELSNILRDWYECEYHGIPGQVGPEGNWNNGCDMGGGDLAQTNKNLVNAALFRLRNSFLIPFVERAEAEASMLKFVWSLPKRRPSDEPETKADVNMAIRRHIVHVADGHGGEFGKGLPEVLGRAWASFTTDLIEHATESYKSF